jgi:pyruvate ferredoxin oxidoreductase alpha subunit
VQRELERSRHGERPGPHAEHMLRDLGTIASGAYE